MTVKELHVGDCGDSCCRSHMVTRAVALHHLLVEDEAQWGLSFQRVWTPNKTGPLEITCWVGCF